MSETLERDEVIELLNALGSDEDEEALLAARALHSKIAQASLSWDELLVADGTEDNELEERDQLLSEESEDEGVIEGNSSKSFENNETEEKDQQRGEVFEDEEGAKDNTSTTSKTSADMTTVDNKETLTLINKLLKRDGNSDDLLEELEDYKIDIANGEFEARDHKYVKALYLRLIKSK